MFSDCLQSFTELEELEESELYMCSTCKKKQRSTKKFWIRRLPNVITFIKPLNLYFVILILLGFFFLIVYLSFGVRIFVLHTLNKISTSTVLSCGMDTKQMKKLSIAFMKIIYKKQKHVFIKKKYVWHFFNKYLLQVLCLHIKRFRWQSFFRVKLETFVEFPLEGLNMHKYILDNLVRTIVFCRQCTISKTRNI